MKLRNYKTKKEYAITKNVYENVDNGVCCMLAVNSEVGECFVKVLAYGSFKEREKQSFLRASAEKEAQCIKKASCCSQNVPRLFDSWDDTKNGRYVIVMEKIEGQSLRDWMKKRTLTELTEKDVFVRAQIIKQLAQIMNDINVKVPSIVHRDLKPENVLIRLENGKWVVSVIDFGCATFDFVRNVGTRCYQAPEQIQGDTSVKISYKTDVFALGQIFYELLEGSVPEFGIDQIRDKRNFQWKKEPSFEKLAKTDRGPRLEKLIKSMTAFDLEARPEYSYIIRELNFKLTHK